MPVKYTIKRNSLSAKWGVWATETDALSPIENLVAELKTSEDAESYLARVEAGEPHEAVMDSLSRKKPKQEGRGLFGKLFKRDSNGSHAGDGTTNNPVIEIQAVTVEQPDEQAEAMEAEPEPGPAPAPVSQRPSRFQEIEQPASPPAPSVSHEAPEPVEPAEAGTEDQLEPEAVAAEPTTDEIEARKRALEQAASLAAAAEVEAEQDQVEETEASTEPVNTETEEQALEVEQEPVSEEALGPVSSAPEPDVTHEETVTRHAEPVDEIEQAAEVEEPVQPAAPAAQTPARQDADVADDSRDSGLLVDWTFTPPPDVTPEEARASGMATPKPAGPETAAPSQGNAGAAPAPSTVARPVSGPEISDNGRMVVEVCVSNAMQEAFKGDARVSDKKYNSIASKEYTEVSKAYSNGNSPDYLKEELTHLAAVCLAWADAIEKRQASENGSEAA